MQVTVNKNDLIREALLEAFYNRFKSAHVKTRAGVFSVRVLRHENLKKIYKKSNLSEFRIFNSNRVDKKRKN